MDNWTSIDNLENMGGILSVYYTPTFNIDNFPTPVNSLIDSYIETVSDPFSKAISTKRDAKLSESSKNMSAGRLYSYEFRGFYPRQDPSVIAILNKNASIPMIAKVKDANGYVRILGTPENPARMFLADGTTGQKPIDRNGIGWMISWQNHDPAPFYQPA